MKLFRFYNAIFALFISLFGISFVNAERMPSEEQFIQMLIGQQMLFDHCREKYPKEMTQFYKDDRNVFEALEKTGGFDQNFKKAVESIFANLEPEKKRNLTTLVSKEIKPLLRKEPKICDKFLIKRIGTELQIKRILYDEKSLKFYINIQDQWLEAEISGYGIGCGCEKETQTDKDRKLRAFISKVKNYRLFGSQMFMAPNSNDLRVSVIHLFDYDSDIQDTSDDIQNVETGTVSENEKENENNSLDARSLAIKIADEAVKKADEEIKQAEDDGKNKNKQEALGMSFGNVKKIAKPAKLDSFTLFYDKAISVYYECEINYRNHRESTCIESLLSKEDF